jgi:hypothetical protein
MYPPVRRRGVQGINQRRPFQFVLDELAFLRPEVKSMFGFTYVYLDDTLLLLLRERLNQTHFNGIWLATTTAHLQSLRKEFPCLPARCVWTSGESASVFLPSHIEEFETYAMRACEIIAGGDRRIGRVSGRRERSKTSEAQQAR